MPCSSCQLKEHAAERAVCYSYNRGGDQHGVKPPKNGLRTLWNSIVVVRGMNTGVLMEAETGDGGRVKNLLMVALTAMYCHRRSLKICSYSQLRDEAR